MAYRDLREFIAELERQGELVRIKAPVTVDLEISAVCDYESKSPGGGKALLFESVKEAPGIPVLINAFGSEKRTCMALGVGKLDDLGDKLGALIESLEQKPAGLIDKFKMLLKLKDVSEYFPKVVRSGPCKDVIIKDNIDLGKFPVIKCWPQDGGRYITLPMVFTKNPVNGKRNCGMYRLQLFGKTELGMHWQIHKHGAEHMRLAKEKGVSPRMEVAIAIGGDPATTFGAICPLPDDMDEMMICGFLRDQAVEMVKCETVDLEVPATSEIVLEGYVDLNETRVEGPFGDHTGFYSLADRYPVFHCTCVTHRKDPIYQTIIVGKPPMEDCYPALAIERLFLPVIKKQFPEVVDMHMPFEGVFHNLIIFSIKKRYPGHARKLMNAVWGLGQMMFSKCIVVVDSHIPVRDAGKVAWYVLNNIDPERDIQFTLGPVDVLDHSSRGPQFGSKMGIDGTRKWPEEGFARQWPEEIEMDPAMAEQVKRRLAEYGLKKYEL